ncbi:MAG: ABC transporter permease [Lachnospiraceae bacterium]|nr:ABC transporter permease [Lachnospiraceae bacterium]
MGRHNHLLTDAVREILHTRKKFISLLIMNFLAVGFLAGLRMTAPDMKHSLDVYYDEQNLMDVRILSTLGLTQDDIDALKGFAGGAGLPAITDAEGSKYLDALVGEDTVTVFSMPGKINKLRITQGREPQSSSECVVEQLLANKLEIAVGDTITINTEDADKLTTQSSALNEHTFTVCGIGISPMYISKTRGNSSIGTGTVTAWVSVPEEVFTQDYYTAAYLTADELDVLECYMDKSYRDKVDSLREALEPLGKERSVLRREQLIKETTITDMMAMILSSGLDSVQVEQGKWYILGRNTLESYEEFSMDSDRMSSLADVFPMIFFLVAALSSLTTMTRMVEDHRTEIGCMKAMGFSARDVSIKYIGYAAASSLTGGLTGWAFGILAIPGIIYYEWGLEYLLPPIKYMVSVPVLAYSVGLAVLATAGSAAAACMSTLTASAASLMRPRAPKPGKRVLLERIPAIWSRLSFIQKVSVRNLFRYKRRFWMTVAGIGGCTALVVTALGLRDSIFDILAWQFDEITCYDAALGISEEIGAADKTDLREELENDPAIVAWQECNESWMEFETKAGKVSNVTVICADDLHSLDGFINLRHREQGGGISAKYRELFMSPINMEPDGIIIDEKMAEILDVNVGSEVMLRNADEEEFTGIVSDITENYVNHYAYMTRKCMKSMTGDWPLHNTILLRLSDDAQEEEVARKLIAMEGVVSYNRIDQMRTRFENSIRSINAIIVIIIAAAALLAFLVLFNLTNINVTERIRELATLKVLGFYDAETASYVYRENGFLTLIGAAAGLFIGKWLHSWLVRTIEVDYLMFGRSVHPRSFVIAAVLTFLFSLSVNFFSFFTIKEINMIESLKSVE